jgi:peptidoglycan-associated lipoprotein
VFFEFDDTAVRGEYAPLIQRHGQYLQSHPSVKVVVQGNTDERGGSEYNLALGQRRAEAVRAALRVYGVRDAQIEAVSLGEERPRAEGHDEGAWRQNRRADIVYPR